MGDPKIPFDGVLFGVFQLALITGMIPGLPRLVVWFLFSIVIWISYYLVTKTTTGDLAVDLAMGSAILTQLMIGLDSMFLTHPDTLKDHQEPRARGSKITEQPLQKRLRWAFNLYTNPRGIGWAHEHLHLPSRPSPSTSLWKFVGTRAVTAMFCAVLELAAHVVNASNSGMTTPGQVLSDSPIHWRVLGVAGFAVAGAARMNAMSCVLSAMIVGLGLSSPERWPNLFGSPLDAWSVQRFWRRVWHQLLRKSLRACTEFVVTNIFRCPSLSHKSSNKLSDTANKFVWLYTAFFIIGIVHVGGEYMLLGRLGTGAFKFFMLQAVAITLEKIVAFVWTLFDKKHYVPQAQGQVPEKQDVPIASLTSPRPDIWIRGIGYIWVSVWFVWSLPFMIDPMVTSGMFVDPPFDLRTRSWSWS